MMNHGKHIHVQKSGYNIACFYALQRALVHVSQDRQCFPIKFWSLGAGEMQNFGNVFSHELMSTVSIRISPSAIDDPILCVLYRANSPLSVYMHMCSCFLKVNRQGIGKWGVDCFSSRPLCVLVDLFSLLRLLWAGSQAGWLSLNH